MDEIRHVDQVRAMLKDPDRNVSLGVPQVSWEWRGLLRKWTVSWTEEVTDTGTQWGRYREFWSAHSAWRFVDSFVVYGRLVNGRMVAP